jgi:hypothetical protein
VKPDPFDALVRRHIQEEAFMIHPDFEKRLARKLADLQVVKSARRISVRSLALAMALLMLLGGAALAASGWGSRLFLTREDGDGQPIVNEELVALAQPIGQVFEGDALRVEIIDAIYDGQSLTLTWTMQNKQSEGDLILLMEDNGHLQRAGREMNVGKILLKPGETIQSGLVAAVGAEAIGKTLDITLDYLVLAPQAEVMQVDFSNLDGLYGDAIVAAYQAEIGRIHTLGGIALSFDGRIELLQSVYPPNLEGVTLADALIADDKVTALETVPMQLTLAPSAAVKSLLPGGQPVEQDNGDYLLRVTQVDYSPGTIRITLERVFKNRAALRKYEQYYRIKEGQSIAKGFPSWWYKFENADNTLSYAGTFGSVGSPTRQADFTWLWPYKATLTEWRGTLDSITIIPYRDDWETMGNYVYFPEEGLTITP